MLLSCLKYKLQLHTTYAIWFLVRWKTLATFFTVPKIFHLNFKFSQNHPKNVTNIWKHTKTNTFLDTLVTKEVGVELRGVLVPLESSQDVEVLGKSELFVSDSVPDNSLILVFPGAKPSSIPLQKFKNGFIRFYKIIR